MEHTYIKELWDAVEGDGLLSVAPEAERALFSLGEDGIPILKDGFGRAFLDTVGAALSETKSAFALLCAIVGVLMFSSAVKQVLGEGSMQKMFTFLSSTVLLSLALVPLWRAISLVDTFSGGVVGVIEASSVSLCAIYAMRGMAASAAASGAAFSIFLGVLTVICRGVLLPLAAYMGGMSLLSAFDASPLSEVSAWLRKTFGTVIGAVMTLLCAVLSIGNVLAQSSDSVHLRCVRFALANMIPVIGGAVGEATSAMTAGVSLVQKTAGVIGILSVLWLLLPPLLSLFSMRIVFELGAGAAGMLGLTRERGVLAELGSVMGFLCALMAALGVFCVLLLSLCMRGGG